MLFSTPVFLFGFLPIFFALYWFLPARQGILLAGSLLFYGWSEPVFLWVVLASTIFDWLLGFQIRKDGLARKWPLTLGVLTNLGLLAYAKYTVFAVRNLNVLLASGHLHLIPVPAIILPLGVSFIVFEKITYLVDLYRGVSRPATSLLRYMNYVFLFPKLLAGPIIKYHDIAAQLERPSHCYEDVREGLLRFVTGLAKKVLIADLLAPIADEVFRRPPGGVSTSAAWIGLACFTVQIYFDFSGYSDMAIGLARILGFRLMENFNDPYLATSFTDFWRRWHISLSTWIKEYLYIPLGGSRVSNARAYANLCLCFVLSGLWHGAAWHYILWGCCHGVALVVDRAFWLDWSKRLPRAANVLLTFFLVAITWVFFRCESVTQAWMFIAALFTPHPSLHEAPLLYSDSLAALAAGFCWIAAPVFRRKQEAKSSGFIQRTPALAISLLLLLVCGGRVSISTFQPFLYFRF